MSFTLFALKPLQIPALQSFVSQLKLVVIAATQKKARTFAFKYFGITEHAFELQVYPISIFEPTGHHLRRTLSSADSYTSGKLNLEALEGCTEVRSAVSRFCDPNCALVFIDPSICNCKSTFLGVDVVTQYNFVAPSCASELEDKVNFVHFAAEAGLPNYYYTLNPQDYESDRKNIEACFSHSGKIVSCTQCLSTNGEGLKMFTSTDAFEAYCKYVVFEGCTTVRIMPYFAGSSLEVDIVVLDNEVVVLPPFLSIFLLEKVSRHVYHFVDCGCENRRVYSEAEISGVHKVCHQVGNVLQHRGYRGFANLNGSLFGNEFILTEINPRPPLWFGKYFEDLRIIDACLRTKRDSAKLFEMVRSDILRSCNTPYISCRLVW
eukprot:CAMPEP_0183819934 /NCGR_PEP_ID=MMETSP0803_2-20130417/64388_1 /TAXON_ID=195967 /ORGANISM="Crustomastix stigmata, Strain CCMP3273" /LENGTH=376 /DNA_ID=CAMNT_0026064825 /DNA_START=147 /DNA_END=1274 /DNA_ORIENTATION=+